MTGWCGLLRGKFNCCCHLPAYGTLPCKAPYRAAAGSAYAGVRCTPFCGQRWTDHDGVLRSVFLGRKPNSPASTIRALPLFTVLASKSLQRAESVKATPAAFIAHEGLQPCPGRLQLDKLAMDKRAKAVLREGRGVGMHSLGTSETFGAAQPLPSGRRASMHGATDTLTHRTRPLKGYMEVYLL